VSEEKKGRVKITVEIEINEALMEIAKEAMERMPEMMARRRAMRKEGKAEE